MAGVVLVSNGFEHRNGIAISTEFTGKELRNAGDGRGTHPGLAFDNGVGNAFGQHFRHLEPTRKFNDLFFGEHVAKESENAVWRIRHSEDLTDFDGFCLECRRFHLL